jgi:hypothetical protein
LFALRSSTRRFGFPNSLLALECAPALPLIAVTQAT